jgi:uncharacterized protein (UPF0332 family)
MKPESKALLEKGKQSLQAATLLQEDGFLDFAASRAYFALFYVAEALLIEKGFSYLSHSAVIAAFGREFTRSGKLDACFYRYLLDAQDTRNMGDYGIGPGVSSEQIQDLLYWADELLKAAEQCLFR